MPGTHEDVSIRAGNVTLEGRLDVPPDARALVVFVHGSGSSRHSPRNQLVARELQDSGFATLLFDLLTTDEERLDLRTQRLRFDIPLLAERVTAALDWAERQSWVKGLPVGLFGASTGAAAAIVAATQRPGRVQAIVSRGGRPDLAGEAAKQVQAPTLLVVGGLDDVVIELNRQTLDVLPDGQMHVVPGASHLFEEEGTLDRVVTLAAGWFAHHLRAPEPV